MLGRNVYLKTVKYPKNRIIRYLFIATHLHSLAPTPEIKKLWELFVIGASFYFIMCLFSGMPFIFGLKLVLPINETVNNNGGYIFMGFVIIFCIVFLRPKDFKKKPLNTMNKKS